MKKPFITPSSLPTELVCRTLKIPDDKQWLGIFNSALLELAYAWNYEQLEPTDLTPEAAAAECYERIVEYLATGDCEDNVPTPYWDSDNDLDDEEPSEIQTWYGEVDDYEAPPDEITFAENAAIWTFTGFIAASGQLGAAVFFNTIAPRFVLALKRGDVGEIIRVIIDAQDYGVMDTSPLAEGDVLELPVLTDESLETHDIFLVKIG